MGERKIFLGKLMWCIGVCKDKRIVMVIRYTRGMFGDREREIW